MYRPPVDPGYDEIGAAIAMALGNAAATARAQRRERQEEERYRVQQARQQRLDKVSEQDRKRDRQIQDVELGVVDFTVSDPVESALKSGGDAGRGKASSVAAKGGVRTPGPSVRGGLIPFGDRYIDPRRSLPFLRESLNREVMREEREAELGRNAERLMALDPRMTRGEAVARAAGLSATGPMTRAQALAQRREELELADVFNARESARSLNSNLALVRERRRDDNTTMGRARKQNEAEGYALTAAHDAIRTGQANPLGGIRVRLRAQLGNRLTEGEIQELAVRALASVQDQQMQSQRFLERNDSGEDDFLEEGGTGTLANSAPPRRAERTVSPQLARARGEWDSIYADIQKIQDPVARNRAIRELGSRP